MSMAQFGVAGNSTVYLETVSKSSLKAPSWLSSIGLDCYEYQCGKGVNVGAETAGKIGKAAADAGITLSLHAPYFINLANVDKDSQKKTIGYITGACAVAQQMGAGRVIIHSGALMKRSRSDAMITAREVLRDVVSACDDLGYADITLCPETMGKINQLGDLDEVLDLCTQDDRLLRLIPCIDFGHLYARSIGVHEKREDYKNFLDRTQEVLGLEKAKIFHSHFSKIVYTENGGEKCHVTFDENDGFGPLWSPLAEEVAQRGWNPTFICESSGTQSQDALRMKQIYQDYCSNTEQTIFY
ncbi:MAG: TIM barrel protein [Eubacteriales bacterium]